MVQQTSVQRAVARRPETNKNNELAFGSRDSRSPLRQVVASVLRQIAAQHLRQTISQATVRFPQFYSRIGFVHEFRPLDPAQVQELLEKKWTPAGVTLPDEQLPRRS